MSQYLPDIAWSTIASNVSIGSSTYRYYVTVNPLDPNEPGASTMAMAINDYFIDYANYPYLIEGIASNVIEVYDILERGDGVTSLYGPYNNQLGYVYRPLNGAIILTQAQLRKLDASAPDIINPIEKGIIWAHDFWEKDEDENIYQLNLGDVFVNRAIQFPNNVANPPYNEGLYFYDFSKHTMAYYNDIEGITVNNNQEFLIPVWNDTAITIENGDIVYPIGSYLPSGETESIHTVALANAKYKEKSRVVAMATVSIAPNSKGYVTRLGSVGGLNTVGYSGIVYLSATTDGKWTNVIPDDGAYIIPIGAIKNIDATNGSITVDPKSTELTVEVTDTNGFPSTQRVNTILSFDNATRTFTIAASSYPFHYYDEGIKYEKETLETIQIADTEGLHAFYYEDDILTTIANPSDGEIDTIIRSVCLIAYIYWDATNKVHTYFGDERHGIRMDPVTHSYLHFTRGAQFLYGLGLGSILADENGSLDSHAQFSIEGGMCADEDITTTYSAIASTVGLPIYYLSGANGDMRRTTQVGFSVKVTGTGRLAWNEWTGAIWQLTEVSDGKFVLCHVFAINGLSGKDQQIAIIGQTEYSTSTLARAGASTEISNVLTRFPFQEIVPVATVIFQTKDSYTNSINARIISTDSGDDYINWLLTELSQGSAVTSHRNLTNLTADDHPQYALLNGRLGDILKIDEIQEYTTGNGVKIDGIILKDTGINFEAGATTRIFKDGSNNLSFTDAITGTKTLAELAAGGGGTPGGSDTYVQFNDGGSFGGTSSARIKNEILHLPYNDGTWTGAVFYDAANDKGFNIFYEGDDLKFNYATGIDLQTSSLERMNLTTGGDLTLVGKLYAGLTNASKINKVYYDSSTKELSYYSNAFAALTDGATVTWDCTTGLNKTLTTSRASFTLSISNVSNGMKGELLVLTTTSCSVTIPSGYSKNYTNGDYPVIQQTVLTFESTSLTATVGFSLEWSYDGTCYYYTGKILRNESSG